MGDHDARRSSKACVEPSSQGFKDRTAQRNRDFNRRQLAKKEAQFIKRKEEAQKIVEKWHRDTWKAHSCEIVEDMHLADENKDKAIRMLEDQLQSFLSDLQCHFKNTGEIMNFTDKDKKGEWYYPEFSEGEDKVFLELLRERHGIERPAVETQCPAASPSASGKMPCLQDRRLAFEPQPLPGTTSDLQVGKFTITVMSTLLVAGGLLMFRCFRRRRKTTDATTEL